MRLFIRLVVLLFSLLGIYFYGIKLLDLITHLVKEWNKYEVFLVSFSVSFILCFLFLKQGNFFPIFEHELTHMLWGLIFFIKPRMFAVSENEGGVVGYAHSTNFIVSLAPYFSLTINFILIGIFYLLKPQYYDIFFAVYGAALGYHTSSTIKEFSPRQPDIYYTGIVFSLVFLIFANIVSYGIALAFVIGRGELVIDFLKSGILSIYNLFLHLNFHLKLPK